MNRKPVIDYNLVADGLLFATAGYRCRYFGTPSWEKPHWLEENKGRYRRLDDVLQEFAQPGQPDNVGAAPTEPNCGTSFGDIRKECGDNDNVSLVRTRPEDRSPPRQLTSLPASSVPLLTDDSQIGANLRVCADEEDRADFDRRG